MSTALTTNEPAKNGETQVATRAPAANVELGGDIITNPAMFEHVQRLAMLLADGAFTPAHLKRSTYKETVATCFRVAAQAIRWGFDPFGVADETYEIRGKLGYQGKLVIAVINSRGGLRGNLSFKHAGSGASREVTVTGWFKDEAEPRTITLNVGQAKTSNDMWTKDPDQKLCYTGATKWARRHCPQVLMGVHTIEDLEAIAERDQPKRTAGSLDELADHLLGAPKEQTPDGPAPDEQPQAPDPLLRYEGMAADASTAEHVKLGCDAVGEDTSLTADQKLAALALFANARKRITGGGKQSQQTMV